MPKLKIGTCFSGIGGGEIAVETVWPNADLRFAVEIDTEARDILSRHWPDLTIHQDVRTCQPEQVDVLVGGFPCQDISRAKVGGKGLAGKRSGLFYDMLDLAERCGAQTIIFENVQNILRRGLRTVCEELHSRGWLLEWSTFTAQSIGAPVMRDRWFAVATRPAATEDSDLVLHSVHRANQTLLSLFGSSSEQKPWRTEVSSSSPKLPKEGYMDRAGQLWSVPSWRDVKRRKVEWPCPMASAPNWNERPETWLARAARIKRESSRQNGMPVTMAVRLGSDWRAKYTAILKGGPVESSQWSLEEQYIDCDWCDSLMGYPRGWTRSEGPSEALQAVGLTDLLYPIPKEAWEPSGSRTTASKDGVERRLRHLGNTIIPGQLAAFLRRLETWKLPVRPVWTIKSRGYRRDHMDRTVETWWTVESTHPSLEEAMSACLGYDLASCQGDIVIEAPGGGSIDPTEAESRGF